MIMGIVKTIGAGLSIKRPNGYNVHVRLWINGRECGGSGDFSASTYYYITFEFDGGERMELEVKDTDFGMIVIGDRGKLHYKGTRFLEFVRVMEA